MSASATAAAPIIHRFPEAPPWGVVPGPLTAAQVQEFFIQGFTLAPAIVPPHLLALLRDECQGAIDRIHAEMDAQGTDTLFINHRGKRYFAHDVTVHRRQLRAFVFGELMAGIVRQLVGAQAYFFLDQYVVKAAEQGMAFGWHQDSGYIAAEHPHRPYLTCWTALDDMSEANGTISVLPLTRPGVPRQRIDHHQDARTNDMVGYDGPDPGDLVTCPAGSIALFSSITFHRSGFNRTERMRRVYLTQYSPEPILRPDGQPWNRAEPFLRDGRVVAPAA
jgi:hypothetical protein